MSCPTSVYYARVVLTPSWPVLEKDFLGVDLMSNFAYANKVNVEKADLVSDIIERFANSRLGDLFCCHSILFRYNLLPSQMGTIRNRYTIRLFWTKLKHDAVSVFQSLGYLQWRRKLVQYELNTAYRSDRLLSARTCRRLRSICRSSPKSESASASTSGPATTPGTQYRSLLHLCRVF